jgi:hypothetical protein
VGGEQSCNLMDSERRFQKLLINHLVVSAQGRQLTMGGWIQQKTEQKINTHWTFFMIFYLPMADS